MSQQNDQKELTGSAGADATTPAPVPAPEAACMYCLRDGTLGHWETVHTGDEESLDGYEDWFCCHPCRDAGLPCETFHRIPIPDKA